MALRGILPVSPSNFGAVLTNIAHYAFYWFLPDFVLRLKATPLSHLRRYVG